MSETTLEEQVLVKIGQARAASCTSELNRLLDGIHELAAVMQSQIDNHEATLEMVKSGRDAVHKLLGYKMAMRLLQSDLVIDGDTRVAMNAYLPGGRFEPKRPSAAPSAVSFFRNMEDMEDSSIRHLLSMEHGEDLRELHEAVPEGRMKALVEERMKEPGAL